MSYPLEREIDFDFDFDFDSFVRGGRGEAVCACETCLLNAGADLGELSSASRRVFEQLLLLCAWVLTTFACFVKALAHLLMQNVWVLTFE